MKEEPMLPSELAFTEEEAVSAVVTTGHRQRARRQRRRVNLDILVDVHRRVVEVQRLAGLSSVRDVFREAFRFYEWYTKRKVEGWSIQLVNAEGHVREVEILS
jgi:hypothetical protein